MKYKIANAMKTGEFDSKFGKMFKYTVQLEGENDAVEIVQHVPLWQYIALFRLLSGWWVIKEASFPENGCPGGTWPAAEEVPPQILTCSQHSQDSLQHF